MADHSGSWTHNDYEVIHKWGAEFTVSWEINDDGLCKLYLNKNNTTHYGYTFDARILIDGVDVCHISTSTTTMDGKTYSTSASGSRAGSTAQVQVKCGDPGCYDGVQNYTTVGGPYSLYKAPSNFKLTMTNITGSTTSCSLSYTAGNKTASITTKLCRVYSSTDIREIASNTGSSPSFTGLEANTVYQLKSTLSDGKTTLTADSNWFRTFKSSIVVTAIDSQSIKITATSNRGVFSATGSGSNGYEDPNTMPNIYISTSANAVGSVSSYSYDKILTHNGSMILDKLFYRNYKIDNWCDGITGSSGDSVNIYPLKLSVTASVNSYEQFSASIKGIITNNKYDTCTKVVKIGTVNCTLNKLSDVIFIGSASGLDSGTTYTGIITITDAGGNVATASVNLTTRFPNVKIWNGSKWVIAEPYIFNGTNWQRSKPFTHNGNKFVECSYYS